MCQVLVLVCPVPSFALALVLPGRHAASAVPVQLIDAFECIMSGGGPLVMHY
jgi:hypothetical protein